MTRRGTCVPPGPSRKIGVRAPRFCCKAGNSRRSDITSNMSAPHGYRFLLWEGGHYTGESAVADRLLRDVALRVRKRRRIAVEALTDALERAGFGPLEMPGPMCGHTVIAEARTLTRFI